MKRCDYFTKCCETVERAQKREQMIRPAGSFPRFVSLFIYQSLYNRGKIFHRNVIFVAVRQGVVPVCMCSTPGKGK